MALKIGVKFCGHCAPRMDMMELYEMLRTRAPEMEFCYFASNPDADVLLILNACQAECASRPDFSGPVAVVTPDSINRWPVPRDQLCEQLVTWLRTAAD